MVPAHRTSSNLLELEIARCLDFFHMSSGWFDCTEPSLTTSLQGIQGVQGAICTGSGRFKNIKPHRTFSNFILTEIARYIEFYYTSLGWFDEGAICTRWMRFKHIEPHRTFSNYILTETARNLYLFHIVRSGSTVPNLLFKSSGDARCAGCNMHRFGEVPAHRTSSNLLELHPHRDSKVYRLLSHEFGVVRLYRTFSTYIFFFSRD